MSGTSPTRRHQRRIQVVAATVSLGFLVAACGDDQGTSASAPGGDIASFCDASLEVVGLSRAESVEDDDLDAARAHAAVMVAAARQVLDASPDSVRTDVETMLAAAEAAAETGDGSAFQSPEFAAAETKWHAAGLEACGWAIERVTMTEYLFDGIPATMAPGITSFELSNDGGEFHVIAILRKNDGVDEDFAELLAKPDGAGFEDMTEVASGFVAPGQSGYALGELTPGEYIAICPIPVGADGGAPEPDALTHFQHGMQQRFTVA